MKIKINILFWGTDKKRLANTNLSWCYLNKFTQYAQDKGLDIESFIFDFSEVNVLGGAIHIPYPNKAYKRSEKINKVIVYHSEPECILAVMDSDLLIDPVDYDALIYLLKKIKDNEFYVFKVNDVMNLTGIDFENETVNFKELHSLGRQFEPDLGGLFIMNNKILNENKFNEDFIVWGGEDNDLSYRLQGKGFKKKLLPIVPYHLPHDHSLKPEDQEQYKKQVDMLNL